jgi:hypothetical protein
MRVSECILIAIVVFFNGGCSEKHLISDKNYLDTVETSFNEKKLLASNRKNELFDVFSKKLNTSQAEALKFLYAFMPLSDLADYNGDFFLANADVALRTRKEAAWGKNIPEAIFLHYVLPCRINNENIDSFRITYYDEITDRIRGMNMEQAALEINHWCHEKVTYQPADIRTSGPESTILSARGRCGEESTFTVSALRTAGIPARQVYTPRWAHTDDNHAWVEIWIDGQWFYMEHVNRSLFLTGDGLPNLPAGQCWCTPNHSELLQVMKRQLTGTWITTRSTTFQNMLLQKEYMSGSLILREYLLKTQWLNTGYITMQNSTLLLKYRQMMMASAALKPAWATLSFGL